MHIPPNLKNLVTKAITKVKIEPTDNLSEKSSKPNIAEIYILKILKELEDQETTPSKRKINRLYGPTEK